MIQNDKEAVEYWDKRFAQKGNVGWGSQPNSEWFNKKKKAVSLILKDNPEVKRVLDICCGDMEFISQLPEFNELDYKGKITVKELRLIDYGLTFVVKSNQITKFLKRERKLLKDKGFHISHLYEE